MRPVFDICVFFYFTAAFQKKMRRVQILLLLILSISIVSCKRKGCMNPKATNYDKKANEGCACCEFEGQLLFWFNQDTKDALVDEGVGTLRYKLNDNLTGTFPVGDAFATAPACNAAGAATLKVKMGSSQTMMYVYTVEDEHGNIRFDGIVSLSGGACMKIQL
jgi:hypothetical protein